MAQAAGRQFGGRADDEEEEEEVDMMAERVSEREGLSVADGWASPTGVDGGRSGSCQGRQF